MPGVVAAAAAAAAGRAGAEDRTWQALCWRSRSVHGVRDTVARLAAGVRVDVSVHHQYARARPRDELYCQCCREVQCTTSHPC